MSEKRYYAKCSNPICPMEPHPDDDPERLWTQQELAEVGFILTAADAEFTQITGIYCGEECFPYPADKEWVDIDEFP